MRQSLRCTNTCTPGGLQSACLEQQQFAILTGYALCMQDREWRLILRGLSSDITGGVTGTAVHAD